MHLKTTIALFVISQFSLVADTQTLTCASDDGRRHQCRSETRFGVHMSRQISGSPCDFGRTWGYEDGYVWVDRGCRAEFAVEDSPRRDFGRNRPSYGPSDSGQNFTCISRDGERQTCRADTRNGIRIVRQVTDVPCRRGSTWDYDESSVWVDRGCGAEFGPGRGGEDAQNYPSPDSRQNYVCNSNDGRRHQCSANTRYGVRLVRQISGSACVKDYSWGFTPDYVWVDHGCRAEFGPER